MIALGGPKLKRERHTSCAATASVSMIALGGPKLKLEEERKKWHPELCFNDSTGWA